MQQKDITSTKRSFINMNQLFTSILEDRQMIQQFLIIEEQHEQQSEQKNEQMIQQQRKKQTQIQQKKPEFDSSVQEEKVNLSRLEYEIKVNNLKIIAIEGQAFLFLIQSLLLGKNNQQKGKLMMTTYRLIFFNKQGNKRVDLPYGLMLDLIYEDKINMIIIKLKYPHQWKFKIVNQNHYQQLKKFILLYYKIEKINNHFAFQYALKIDNRRYQFNLKQEYKRLNFHKDIEEATSLSNKMYSICATYPEQIYVSPCNQSYLTLAKHRKNNRFPILAYVYSNHHSKINVPLWISSNYEDIKYINGKVEKQMLTTLAKGLNLEVFVAQSKNNKSLDQSYFQNKNICVNYMKLQTNQQVSLTFHRLFQVYLYNKTPFLKEIINSKWYEHIKNILYNCQIIRNLVLKEHAIIIRCQSGFDKSLLMASLMQIILDPQFRTFKGFQSLVMRMFVHNGHPFGDRLGSLSNNQHINHIFLQFLDCVSQLIHQNSSSFQYNSKYLAKIANLMYTNIYGTFLCNSSKEYIQNKIEVETMSIWSDLINPLTINGFYNCSKGILRIEWQLNSLRIWKQYFALMIIKKKDDYKILQNIEDNQDYLNIFIQQIKNQNTDLKVKMKQKIGQIQKLKQMLADKQRSKENNTKND